MKKLSNSYCHLQCGMSDDEKIDDEESTQCSSNAKIVGDIFIKEGFNLCQIIGNFGNAFIICYYDGKIYLVDQHAASEKSLYMRFIEEKKLLPSAYEGNIFQVENIYGVVLQEEKDSLKQLGWTYEVVEKGPVFTNVRLTTVPSIFDRKCRQQEFQQIIDSYFHRSMQELSKSQKQSIAITACHNAYRIGDQLNHDDMRTLIDALYRMSGAFNCPHGRPTLICLGTASTFIQPIKKNREYPLY